jgi:Tol biopolymer transport system component
LNWIVFDVSSDGAEAVGLIGLPGDLWRIDARHGDLSRITDGADDADPRLSADGRSALFGGTYDGRRGLDVVELPAGVRTRVYEPPTAADTAKDPLARLILHDWSRDGRMALVDLTGRHLEISAVTLATGQVRVAVRGSGGPDQARFSPDGKWIAYNDLESGRPQVFVVPFPPTGERWKISPLGGTQPEWRADGRELFFLDAARELMSVDIPSQSHFAAGLPRLLFQTTLFGFDQNEEYRVTADGQRFLLRVPVGGPARTTLVLNWPSLLRK